MGNLNNKNVQDDQFKHRLRMQARIFLRPTLTTTTVGQCTAKDRNRSLDMKRYRILYNLYRSILTVDLFVGLQWQTRIFTATTLYCDIYTCITLYNIIIFTPSRQHLSLTFAPRQTISGRSFFFLPPAVLGKWIFN